MLLGRLLESFTCRECNNPRWLGFTCKWTEDGLFHFQFAGYEPPPCVIVELDEHKYVYEALERSLGVGIGHIITEAERKSIKYWYTSMMEKYPSFLAGNRLIKWFLVRTFVLLTVCAGYGRTRILSLDTDSHVVYHGWNLHYHPVAVGEAQGFFEAFCGGPTIASSTELDEGEYIILVVKTPRPTELGERLEYQPKRIVPGSLRHEVCPRCGAPRQCSYYSWDYDTGRLVNSLTGQREIVVPTQAIESIYRELKKELGEGTYDILVNAQREYASRNLERYGLLNTSAASRELRASTAENLEILVSDLPLRGMGNPVEFSFQDGVLQLRVENPYIEALICGKALGWYEALEGRRGRLEWSIPEGRWAIDIRVTPEEE